MVLVAWFGDWQRQAGSGYTTSTPMYVRIPFVYLSSCCNKSAFRLLLMLGWSEFAPRLYLASLASPAQPRGRKCQEQRILVSSIYYTQLHHPIPFVCLSYRASPARISRFRVGDDDARMGWNSTWPSVGAIGSSVRGI